MLPAGFKIVDNNMGISRLCFFIETSKNNNKLSLFSGSSPSKRIKISEDANYTSDEDNLFSTRLNRDKTSMKKPKRLPRRSARQPAKKTGPCIKRLKLSKQFINHYTT